MSEANDLQVDPEPLFSASTDNVPITVIRGTEKGRLFLGGKDGCLYEAVYQTQGGWFNRKSRKINHSSSSLSFLIPSFFNFYEDDPLVQIEVDNSRNILFTRSEKGTIEVYDLGIDGQQLSKVASKSLHTISHQAASIARTIEADNFRNICHINVVEESESVLINLIAFTHTGVRIYFSTSRLSRPDQRPDSLNIVHIRLPPGYCASSVSQRPSSVHLAHYRRGSCLMVSSTVEGRAFLIALSSDAFAFDQNLMELSTVLPISSRVWRMEEELKPQLIKQYNSVMLGQSKSVALEPPVLVTQEMEEQRKYVFLSSQGVHIAYKPRPVDHLKKLLINNQGFDNEAVRGFFRLYGEAQGSAIALTLACSTVSIVEKQIVEWATMAYFRYGGDPQLSTQFQQMHQTYTLPSSSTPFPISNSFMFQPNITNVVMSPQISTPQHRPPHFSNIMTSPISPTHALVSSPSQTFMNSPTHYSQVTSFSSQYQQLAFRAQQQQQQQQSLQYSHKVNGLYIYISRILRPFWSYNVVRVETVNEPRLLGARSGKREVLQSSISDTEINIYLQKLNNIKQFMMKNVQLSANSESNHISSNVSFSNPIQVSAIVERNAFSNALELINQCIEILGLWKLVYEHQFDIIISNLSNENLLQLKMLTFRDLITVGKDICSSLASNLVQKYIDNQRETDTITRRLHEACPSIFKQENALHAKAHEMLMKVKKTEDKAEKQKLIKEAVKTYKQIGPRINIFQACDLLQSVGAYVDIVDLCLTTAESRDKDNVAFFIFETANEDVERKNIVGKEGDFDEQEKKILNSRIECYRILLTIYERLDNQSKFAVGVKTCPGNEIINEDLKMLTSEEAESFANAVLNAAVSSKDELFHNYLYDWLYERQLIDKLLDLKSPHFEAYLKRKTKASPDSIQLMDLLWMYYERNGNFRGAAYTLDKLAERQCNKINLYQRLEYLSRAIICLKSCQTNLSMALLFDDSEMKTSGEFLHELQEKMEVARIQLHILETLSKKSNVTSTVIQEAVTKLNANLFDITQLYEQFADKFNLPECQLAILNSAAYHDPGLVESLWEKIV